VYEAFNMAELWKLPVVYIIENNRYGMGTSIERASAQPDLSRRGASFDIPGEQVDGMDVRMTYDAAQRAIAHARSGKVKPVAVLQTTPLQEFPQAAVQNYDDPKALTVRSNLSVVVKSGTPQAAIDKLYAAINEGMREPDAVKALDILAYAAVLTPPKESKQFLLAETQRYGELVKASGLEKQ
jgi:tripartite-type tricarboxylate transporter receptor subunit TctC